jgi:hypothetical protein
MRKLSESDKVQPINLKQKRSINRSPKTNPPASKRSSKSSRIHNPLEENRTASALRRIGVKADLLEKQPQISDMLARIYKKPHSAVNDLRFSPDPVAVRFLAVYDEIPEKDRQSLPIEAICLKAGVDTKEFLGLVFLMRQSLGKAEGSLIAVHSFPKIVKNMVKYAGQPGGVADRKMLAQHPAIGFLPSPKGATLSVKLFGSDVQFSSEDEEQEDDDAVFNATFSGKQADLEEWAEDRRALLSDGK